ncbi:DUF1800 family protein [Pleomorphomonas sp. PLEO]|uniref:DUF1800 domain-containing protein n=1 Tax=Pleomorphomonas sp. PLEO TaxID=3239306 RepID=UPI00351EEAF6
MSIPSDGEHAFIALNRFGLGARPGDKSPDDPKGWLLGQFETFEAKPAAMAELPSSDKIFTTYREDSAEIRSLSEAKRAEARQELRKRGQKLYDSEIGARGLSALTTQAPFVERLVHFWANHFALSADEPLMVALAGSFEREAIRPHVLGPFEDMLLAVEKHPAMLLYLNQNRSIGPNSIRAKRAAEKDPSRKPGINENLAREILELHTLGVRTGYSQKDVTQFAFAMTGWTVAGQDGGDEAQAGAFEFRPQFHEPGPRTILGRTYSQQGMDQAEAVLGDAAHSKATATHVATKLARHFVADEPPLALVKRLQSAFLQSQGDLPTVYRALISAPEAWTSKASKFKTPWEWSVSALRALGSPPDVTTTMAQTEKQLGQPVWRPQSPAGYDDIAASWVAPDVLVRRVEVAQRLARKADPTLDARAAASALLGPSLSKTTATEIARAESPATALALLLVSPEFQRR